MQRHQSHYFIGYGRNRPLKRCKQILAKVAELSDGTLMLNMKRCQSIDIEKKGARSVAVARDLCRTWTCLRLKVGMTCEVQRHGQWVPC